MEKFRCTMLLGCALVAATYATVANAQQAAPGGGQAAADQEVQLQEIVVTAQKREESLQDTPISIVAFTSDDLEQKNITNVTDLRSLVPNVQLTPHPNGAATTMISIRGIGITDDQITQDPSVAIYLDGVYVARSQGLAMDIADLERIEVLRGPQGTLYGRNAKGGAVNFITVAPALGKWEFKEQLTLGNRDYFRTKTSVNVPVGDRFAARLSYLNMEQDGFVRNLGSNVERFGDRDREGWRADLLWQPVDAFELRYAYDRSQIDDTPAFIAAAPLYPLEADRPSAGSPLVSGLIPNDITAQGHSLIATWDIADGLTAKSITAYRKLSNFQNENMLAGALGPRPLFINESQINQDQWTQELQLLGENADNSFNYIVGLYYFAEDGDLSSKNIAIQTPTTQTLNTSAIDNKAYAAFGQATWSPAVLDGRLHLTAGARWSRDERKATLQRFNRNLTTGVVTPVPGVGDGDRSFDNVSPTAIVAYDISDDINVYAKYARGYKTGGYNTRASSIPRFNEGFDEETLNSYEIGIKSQFWDDRVRFNATAFRGDYKDIQLNIQSDPTNPRIVDVLNAGKAVIQGIEIDTLLALAPGLTVSANYGYLDGDYKEVLDAAGRDLSSTFRFLSPKHSYGLDATYRLPETPIGRFTANANYTWQDKKFTSTSNPSLIIDDYALLNGRLTLSDIPGLDGLRVALWGKNLTDKEYYIAHFNLGTGINPVIFGDPRSYGIEAIFEF